MKRFVRYTIALITVFVLTLPAGAVFKEKNLNQTLAVLHYELRNAYAQLQESSIGQERDEIEQHKTLIKLIETCNELSLMLYSQQQDYTFDLTYALDEVTNQYLDFNLTRLPYEEIVSSLEIEIDRYEKLIRTLKKLPPSLTQAPVSKYAGQRDSVALAQDSILTNPSFVETPDNPYLLDSLGQDIRDSCLYYAEQIVVLFWDNLFRVDEDNSYYQETDTHLRDAYNYAQERYRIVQEKIFTEGQDNIFETLGDLRRKVEKARQDCIDKYSTTSRRNSITSEWRGPMVVWFTILVLFYIVIATILANLIVRLTIRWVKYFQTAYFQDHKVLFVLLAGVIIFALTISIVNMVTEMNFLNMAIPLLAEFAWLLAAIFTSLLIRLRGSESRQTLRGYFPIILMGLIIITFRIIFIPNSLINIIFPPILLGFTIWQFFEVRKCRGIVKQSDFGFLWVTFAVLLAASGISMFGYVMLALVVVIWWIFQLTLIQTILAVYFLLTRYYETHLSDRLKEYRTKNMNLPLRWKGAFIEVTWVYDLVKMVLVPLAGIWSIPLCIYMAGNVFDLGKLGIEFFNKPFVNIQNLIHLSLLKVLIVISLFFLFRYLSYAFKALFRVWRTRSAMKKLGDVAFKETLINFTLSDNIITLLCWGLFVIICFLLLRIPTSAITIVSTGLATGIGFAMKDVLNNFFYGLQLMSGRLRVGDVIECDGIRGTVDSMSYQSTQILSNDGAIIAFPNSTLFNKNFKNLTRSHSYEMLKIPFGVAYGTDVDRVRELVVEALKPLQIKDKYGRDVVDPKRGVTVRFDSFGDNSINLTVFQFTTVDTHYTYAAQAKEIIYKTLTENGIEIPFPQQDIYIKSIPEKELAPAEPASPTPSASASPVPPGTDGIPNPGPEGTR